MSKTSRLNEPASASWRRRRTTLWFALGVIAPSCVLDSDDRCGPNQVVWGDDERCVCAEGTAYTAEGCISCGDNEVASPAGCVCAPGFIRPSAGQACEEVPPGIGQTCTSAADCLDPDNPYCQQEGTDPGFCTSTGCSSREDCPLGYFCITSGTPTYCGPPVGAGRPCTTPADCAGTDATFCDNIVSGTCLVQDCNLATNDCFTGTECCDVSAFGLPNLCVAQGACQE